MVKPLSFIEKLSALHRIWRYRLNTEKESIGFLLSQNLLAKTVVDIGGNKGIYSYWMSRQVGDKGAVVVFEPQPELGSYLESLRFSFQLNNLIIVNKALSSSLGRQSLYRVNVGHGGASLIKNSDEVWQSVEVEVTTLDQYFSDWKGPKIDFIKCDVEGNELGVFKGGKKKLLEDYPTLLFECHHKEAEKGELFSFLVSLGYDGFFLSGNERIHYSKFDSYSYRKPGVTFRNYMFVCNNKNS
jgi:FkbM family methyltransferase